SPATCHRRKLQSGECCVCRRGQRRTRRLRQDGATVAGRRARGQWPAQRSADGVQIDRQRRRWLDRRRGAAARRLDPRGRWPARGHGFPSRSLDRSDEPLAVFRARDHRQGTKGISGCRERQRREPDASATLRRDGHVPEEWRNEQLWQGSAASGTGACGYQSCAQCCQPTGPCTMKMRTVAVLAFLVGVASFTAGCTVIDTVGDWFDAGPKKSKLRGERISVMSADASLHLDQSLKGVDVVLPPPYANSEWPEPGGYASNAMYHLEAKGPLRKLWEQDAGKGS